MAFTDKSIAALKPKAARYEVWEGKSGLGIRVGTSGKKTWIAMYRHEGIQKRLKLGVYPKVMLAKARLEHAQAKDLLDQGTDPNTKTKQAKAAERNAETVAQLTGEYLERHARKKKKSADQDQRTIDREIIPVLGKKKAKAITRRDIMLLLDDIEERGSPVMRNRTASLLSKVFRFGLDRGIVDASPAVGIERLEENARERLLSPTELRSFWSGLDTADMDRRTALALKFTLLTGQRRGEVAGTVANEIDQDALWWIPGERTKNGRTNVVPLPALAMRTVKEADMLRTPKPPARPNRKDRAVFDPKPSPWLFASRIGKKPLEPAALTRALNRNRDSLGVGDATIHDLRRTFATVHGELGTPPEILKALLNHTPTEITEKVYNLAVNLEPRRKAMFAWCSWLETVLAGPSDADKMLLDAIVRLQASKKK